MISADLTGDRTSVGVDVGDYLSGFEPERLPNLTMTTVTLLDGILTD